MWPAVTRTAAVALVVVVGALGELVPQPATAVDNTRRYQEVLRLAERDALTGLLNHGGIHSREILQ